MDNIRYAAYTRVFVPKNAKIRIKYPIFGGFALESADHRSSNTYNEPKTKNPTLDKPLLCT